MKIFICVAVVALLCVQTLHGTPVNGEKVVVTETKDGGTVTRTTTTTSGTKTSSNTVGNAGGSFSNNGEWIQSGANGAQWNIGDGKSGSWSYQSSSTTNGGSANGQIGGGSASGQIGGGSANGQIGGGSANGQIDGGSANGQNGGSTTWSWSSSSTGGVNGGGSTGGINGGGSTGGINGGGSTGSINGGGSTGGINGGGSTGGINGGGSTGGINAGGSTGGINGGGSTGGINGGGSTGGINAGGSTGGINGGGSTGGHNGGGSTGGNNGGGSSGGDSDEGSSGGESGEGSSEENSSAGGSGKPCGCGSHFDFNVDDIDLSAIDSTEINSHSTIIQQARDKDCEKQRARLNNDNDNLTRQLKNANAALATLTEEKSWVLTELEECRDEYDCMSSDFVILSTDIKIYKKKYQLALDEVTKLKTLLIASNTDGLTWKTKAENLYIEYNKAIQINIQNTQIINEYNTTIINLRKEVSEIKIQINNCGTESGEWKTKYDNEKANNAKLTATIKTLEITIAEWKSKNEKLTGELSCCQNGSHDKDIEIDDYKNVIVDLKSQVSKITIDFNNCNVKYNQLTIDFSEDQKDDLAILAEKDQLQLQLNECNGRADQLTIDYQAEKTRANECSDNIVVVRTDCQNRYSQYEIQINELTINFQGRLDDCEADLTIERNTIVNINIDITNLRNELTEIKNQWSISIETSNEWQVKSENCQISSVTLEATIETLRATIDKTNEQLETCIDNSQTLQGELSASQGKLDECETDLAETDKEVEEKDAIITALNSDVLELEDAKTQCNGNLSALRCSINKFLPVIQDAEAQATQAILNVIGLFDNNKAALGQFVDGHNIECESCGTDGPCISNGVAPA